MFWSTHGTGLAKVWWPCTPAMAAGLAGYGWSFTEVLLYRVPPWPQLQTVEEAILVDDYGVV